MRGQLGKNKQEGITQSIWEQQKYQQNNLFPLSKRIKLLYMKEKYAVAYSEWNLWDKKVKADTKRPLQTKFYYSIYRMALPKKISIK